jgi:hypothetical protein
MDVHKNARLTPAGREIMVRRVVEGGQTPEALSATDTVATQGSYGAIIDPMRFAGRSLRRFR